MNKVNKRKLFSCVFIFPFILIGCLDSSDGNSPNSSQSLEVQFECSPISAPACSASLNSKTTYVGLTNNNNIDCEQYIVQIGNNFFYLYFDASGTTSATWDGSNLVGNVNFWVNDQNQTINNLPTDSYTVCVFTDTNGSGELDSGEPIGQGEFNPAISNSPVNDFLNH